MTAGGTREIFRNRKQKEKRAFQTISTFFTLTAVYLFALLISPLMSIMKDYLFYYDSYNFI